jgi:nucleotide-binding universal stress UspA family protein
VRLDGILVPTDLSPLGDEAVAYANALAPPGATLHLLHVLEQGRDPNPLYAHYGAGRRSSEQDLDQLQRDVEHALRTRVVAQAAAHRVSMLFHVVRDAAPADAICDMAERLDVGAVCMSTHGCSGLTHLIGGSVAQEVAKKMHEEQRDEKTSQAIPSSNHGM